jgi:hypothetical protein
MTTVTRTLLLFGVASSAFMMAAAACGETITAGNYVNSSAARYAAIADDICVGVPAKEREMGLLAFRYNIMSVTPLNATRFAGKAKYSQMEGVAIKLRATPGISVPWLERVNGCHVALVASGRLPGNVGPSDPFILPGTTVEASEVYAGFVLSLRGQNYDAAREILQRSYALISPPGGVKTAALEAH